MKKTLIFILAFGSAISLMADVDFKTLQAFTNQIVIAYSKGLMAKSDLTEYLAVLSSKEKPESERPSEEEIVEATRATNVYAVTKHIAQMPPSKALPLYFALLENDQLMDREMVFCSENYSNSFANILNELIFIKLDVKARANGGNKTPETLFFWRAGGGFPQTQQTLFWYYIGLDYLPTLWEDWYTCWKLENKREKPRQSVLKKLAKDLSFEFGYHVYPFIAEAIRQGDETFQPFIDILPKREGYNFPGWNLDKPFKFSDPKSFLAWWDENKDDFILPPHKKITEVSNVYVRKNMGVLGGIDCYNATIDLGKKLEEYCKLKERPLTNCWYFNIKEGDLEK